MLETMKAGQTSSGMVQLAGGVEHIERIKPQPAPPPCPPGQAPVPCPPVDTHAPMGPPVAVHEPAPGERAVIEVIPNQPLIFDFNPLDLKASQHDGSVVLTFPDGAQVELHDIVGPCGVQPTPFQLPDGTVITPGDLLQAFHLEVLGPCGLVAPTPIVPHHEVPNTGFLVSPFEVGELGPGLYGLGPLWPTGFGYGAEFLHGTGGSHFAPPGPPGPPPPPPPGGFTVGEDTQSGVYSDVTPTIASADYFGDTNYLSGLPVFSISPSSPPLQVTSYSDVTTAAPGSAADGVYGTLTFDSPGTLGSYHYDVTNITGPTSVSQLGSDVISEMLAQQGLNAIQGSIPFGYYEDTFQVTTSNGSETQTAPLNFYTFGADVYPDATDTVPVAGFGSATSTGVSDVLVTYTDAVDPAHSFQEVLQITSSGVSVLTPPVAPGGVPIEPNDPALLTFQYLSGSTGTVTFDGGAATTVTVAGETVTIPAGSDLNSGSPEFTAMINPNLNGLGDPGDTGTPGTVVASQAGGAPLGSFTDPNSNYTSTGYTGSFGFYDATTGAGNVDTVSYNGLVNGVTLTGSSTVGSTSVLEWGVNAPVIDGTDNFIGTTAAAPTNSSLASPPAQGLNVLEIESTASQDLVFNGPDFFTGQSANLASGVNVQNVEVFDLTDAANPATNNYISLSATDVLNLAQNEPNAVVEFGNGAASVFVLGNGNDYVTLTGAGSTSGWTQGPAVTQGSLPIVGSPMAGFTEYSATLSTPATLSSGQVVSQVHVYVENAIATAGGGAQVHHA